MLHMLHIYNMLLFCCIHICVCVFTKHIYTYTVNSSMLVTLTDDQVQNKDIILKHYQQKKNATDF